MKAAICVSVLAIFAGCSSMPEELGTSTGNPPSLQHNAGEAPTKDAAEKAILAYLKTSLKDPDSLKQFEMVSGPTFATWYRGVLRGGGTDAGWLHCFKYNAKNSYGAYTVVKTEGLMLRTFYDGRADYISDVNWTLASRTC